MKKSVRIIALVMAILTVSVLLVACGKTLSGKYSAEVVGTGVTYEFKGSKVTITAKVLGQDAASIQGSYKIKDDKITITIDGDDKEAKDKYAGTFDFKETDNGIKIGVVEYKKAD